MAALTAPINSRLTPAEKAEFTSICDSIGTSTATAIRMFIKAFNKRGGFPFDPSNVFALNSDTLRAIDDASNGKNLIGPFDSVDAMMASLEDE